MPHGHLLGTARLGIVAVLAVCAMAHLDIALGATLSQDAAGPSGRPPAVPLRPQGVKKRLALDLRDAGPHALNDAAWHVYYDPLTGQPYYHNALYAGVVGTMPCSSAVPPAC